MLVFITAILSILNIFIVYAAAFKYKVAWYSMIAIMAIATTLYSMIQRFFITKSVATPVIDKKDSDLFSNISSSIIVLIIGLVVSISILIILSMRFSFLKGISMTIISGLISRIMGKMLSVGK